MKKLNFKKIFFLSALALTLASGAVMNASANEAPRDVSTTSQSITIPKKPENAASDATLVAPTSKLLTEKQNFDLVLGDAKAPVKIIEYASLGCIHCKHFHDEVFYELKKRFIDTGKVQFTYRHFPLNSAATKGASIVTCAPDDARLAYIGALFKAQSQWAFTDNDSEMKDKLKTISKIGGMNDADFEKCFNDEKRQDEILALMKQAYEEIQVETTPSIFIDGVRFDGARTIESFAEVINEKLQNAAKADKK